MSVVKETRQIFSVSDIKAIRLQCNGKDCKAEVVVSPGFPYVKRLSTINVGCNVADSFVA